MAVSPGRVWLIGVCWIGRGHKPQSVVMTAVGGTDDDARAQAVRMAREHIGDKAPKGGVGVVAVELLPGTLREMLERSEAHYEANPEEPLDES